MELSLSDVTAFTQQFLVPRSTDTIFKKSPTLARLFARRRLRFPGGLYIQRPIIYAQLNGGWFSKGEQFNIDYVPTDTAFTVIPKATQVNITLYGLDDMVNRGEQAVFSEAETKFANASMTMAALLSTGLYQDGQSSVNPPFTGALSGKKSLDGLLAWIDDGNSSGSYSSATDATKSFLSVGGITRSDLFNVAPTFSGATTPISAVQGANSYVNRALNSFSLNALNIGYTAAYFGNEFPDLMPTTPGGFNQLWNSIQPMQRYYDTNSDVGKIGFQSFRFNASDVVVDKYIPSDGTNGLLFMLNTNSLELYVSTNKKFQFGFTGFKEAQNSIEVAGQFLFGGNLVCASPRLNSKYVGSSLI